MKARLTWLIPLLLILGFPIGYALSQNNFLVGLGSQIVSAALQQPQFAQSGDFNVTYRGSTGAAIIAPVSSLLTTGTPVTTSSVTASGSPPTLTGTCASLGTQIGGNTAGSFVATCTAQTAILTFALTAPHGWVCVARDQTTVADSMNQTSSSQTSCTLTGTTAAADVIIFSATAF